MQAFKGDIGTMITLELNEDVSASTVRKIKYRNPNGVLGEWTAALTAPTQISFTTTVVGDLSVVGRWALQAYIEIPGWKGHSTLTYLDVFDTL